MIFSQKQNKLLLVLQILSAGIDFSNDPLLQGRLFSYTDTHLHRLGTVNFNQIPINKPVCPFHTNRRGG